LDRDARGVARVIVVIGGGWAGCAAAVELAQHGFRVELHDAAYSLGGRARAVVRDGLPLDNGEHLLLGAYVETLRVAAVVHEGAAATPWIKAPLAIRPLAPQQHNALTLRARSLPAPLGLLAGVVRARGFTWRERGATIRWFAALRSTGFRCTAQATVADVVAPLPARVRDNLWYPLCVAALNTPTAEASGQVFLNVLREAFAGAQGAAQMVLPRDGLAAAFPGQAADWLRTRGHVVHLSSRVRVLDAAGVRIADAAGERRADAAIVAVGPHQLAGAFDPALASADGFVAAALGQVAAFAWQPIVTVYLGYEQAVALPRGLVRLDDTPGQWLFDRRDILCRAAAAPLRPQLGALLSVVISTHGEHDALDQPALVAAVDAQLRRLRPSLPPLCWSQVIAEKRATYACVPALARPGCGRLTGRVYLAGDYTYPAFPATLEAAVRSGVAAARAIIADVAQ
jgi:squalene-associated FAD-dependent desaturase